VAKKYTNSSAKGALSVKEQSQAQIVETAPHYATPEMMQKAVSHVMKVHGTALQKLAK
jgi:Holliday junction resolvase-like predicted endonuclease